MYDDPLTRLNLPEPIEDYDSERSQVQFDLEIDEDVDVKWNLQIDELIAKLGCTGDTWFTELSELIWDFCYRRRYRFNWLRGKTWRIESLRLFFEFLECWEDNQDWWEANFYNRWLGSWQPVWNAGHMSLDSCYILVHLRRHCTPEEVINQGWFEDWHEYELWAKGFPSFLSFALFRAELGDDVDWYQEVVQPQLAEESSKRHGEFPNEVAERGEELSLVELIDRRYTIPDWLLHQDWYDPSDWLDNLN